MRILHVIPALAPRYGGPSAATPGMCRALARAGVETLMAATDADGPVRLPVELGRTTTFDGAPAIFFRRRLSESFKWGPDLATWLGAHVREFDAVHVHAVFSHASIAAGRAAAGAGVPYIVRPLGTLDPWSVARKPLRKRALFALGAERLLRGAAAIHYTSAGEQLLAESVVPGLPPGVVVPLGVDDEAFAAAADAARPPYVLSLSRLDPKKGLDLLVGAFAAATAHPGVEPWRLVMAGDGEAAFVTQLRALVDASPARPRIELRGWVAGDDKRALLGAATLFVAPSAQENFGLSIVEAMASGTPVLATPGVNLAPEIAAAGAGWTADRTERGLADALARLMREPASLAGARVRARAFAERFRWPTVAAGLVAMYQSACRGPVAAGLQTGGRAVS